FIDTTATRSPIHEHDEKDRTSSSRRSRSSFASATRNNTASTTSPSSMFLISRPALTLCCHRRHRRDHGRRKPAGIQICRPRAPWHFPTTSRAPTSRYTSPFPPAAGPPSSLTHALALAPAGKDVGGPHAIFSVHAIVLAAHCAALPRLPRPAISNSPRWYCRCSRWRASPRRHSP
ncbi:hypothetical protein C8R44DRAFT_906067, partial [Mycena epipterygia]